ncbi:MAG TPA: formylglycine-generating enzyme family protein [Steroidobacteraceae bacterium]|nr:formylglycine-generating enzyme family protein [Steroidobacteraceae bacterium]
MRRAFGVALLTLCIGSTASAASSPQRLVEGGDFRSVLPPAPDKEFVNVKSFRIDVTPVTNAQFAGFVRLHPEWRRDKISKLFADQEYLSHWEAADKSGNVISEQPVTHVSWFAASAYCEAHGGRLPTWYEWEYLAAASETEKDARNNEEWRQRILSWYAKPATAKLPPVGKTPANIYGVRDVHGVVWEWIDDFNSILVSPDNREQGDPDVLKFCGTGALSMSDKNNYAILMRIALFSSLQGHYTTASLGFRCASDVTTKP